MNPLTPRRAAIGAALTALLAPSAMAADLPVATPAEFTAALTAAGVNADADRIIMAAGTYTFPSTITYTGLGPLEVVGAGRGATVIELSAGAGLNLAGPASARVAHLTVDYTGTSAAFVSALRLAGQTPGSAVEDVAVDVTGVGSNVSGIRLDTAGATLTDVAVTGSTNGGVDIVRENAVLTDVDVTAASGAGISAEAGTATNIVITRAGVSGGTSGIGAMFGATVTVRDSLIRFTAGGRGLDVGDSNNSFGFASSLTAERVTVIGPGSGTGATVAASGSAANGTDNMSLTVTDSVIEGVTTPVSCFAVAPNLASLTTSRVNGPTAGTQVATCTAASETDRTTLTPGFADAANGDYRLRHDSPLRDLGATTPASGATDLAGGARMVDGDGNGAAAVDLGAYEYQRTAPALSAFTSQKGPFTVNQVIPFSASATDPDPLEDGPFTYQWTFSDGAAATGSAVGHAFATAGTHTATVSVTDVAGVTSTATVTVTVTAPPAPPVTPPTTPVTPPAPPATPPAAPTALPATGPTTKATLTRLTVARTLPPGRTATARVTVTGTGTLRVTATLKAGTRTVRRITVTARPGTTTLRFRTPATPGRYRLTATAAGISRSAQIVVR